MTTEPVVVSVTALPAAQDSTVSAPRASSVPARPALAPTIVSALSMVRFSLYVPAPTTMVSPAVAALIAAWMVA